MHEDIGKTVSKYAQPPRCYIVEANQRNLNFIDNNLISVTIV